MQPVTIKADQYINTRWLSQGLMGLLFLSLFGYGWQFNIGYCLGCPVLFWFMIKNHQNIVADRQLGFKMQVCGSWYGLHVGAQGAEQTAVKLLTSWHHPGMMFLKIKHPERIIYATIRRADVGATNFSHLWVGTTTQIKDNE